jgi:hypothetical protein
MSKEMREQIDKVKNWKQFLNENIRKTNPYIYDNPKLIEMIEKTIEPSSFICTWVASAVKMLEGDSIKVYGFSTYQNPDATYFVEENGLDSDEGHHFAVMDNRYIIDPWIYDNFHNGETFNRSVFDLQNKNDEEIIKYIYGDRNKWVDITNSIEKHDKFEDLFPKTYKDLIDYYNTIST